MMKAMKVLWLFSTALCLGCEVDVVVAKPNRELVVYTADWCGVCRQNEPQVRQIEQQVKVTRIDIDQVDAPGITSIPVYVLKQNGKEVYRTQNIKTLIKVLKAWKWLH